MTLPPAAPSRYTVDAGGRIVEIGGGWDAFARDNGAPELAGGAVVGRPLQASVTEPTTWMLYEALLLRVRAGHRVAVPFRCDGPAVRRAMRLEMSPGPDGRVTFDAILVASTARAPVALLDASVPRSAAMVVMCAWCRRVAQGADWVEVEEAVFALRLFDVPALPRISHGICPPCLATVRSAAS